jgi:hypothetical protein
MKRSLVEFIRRAAVRWRLARALRSLNASAVAAGIPEMSFKEWFRGCRRLSKVFRASGLSCAEAAAAFDAIAKVA